MIEQGKVIVPMSILQQQHVKPGTIQFISKFQIGIVISLDVVILVLKVLIWPLRPRHI